MSRGPDQGTIAAALARAPLPPRDRCDELAAALGRFAVIDLETTGLDPDRARVIEVGAVLVEPGREPRLLHSLVDPAAPLPAFTRNLTGLTEAELVGAPAWPVAARALAEQVLGAAVVAHNASFEQAFLGGILPRGTAFLDTLELACVLRPELPGHSLEVLSSALLGRRERHRALDDSLDTLALLALWLAEIRRGEHDGLRETLAEIDHAWPWAALLAEDESRLGPLALRQARSATPQRNTSTMPPPGRGAAALAEPIPAAWYEPGFVRELLADEPRWRRELPSYRAREGQIELACAMLEALKSNRSVAAEAGTGIGKTLAYCLVATLHSLHTGERVVISSANRTLQERVVAEELPRIAAVLGIDLPPAIVLKGRANYPDAHRARAVALRPTEMGFAGLSPAARLYLASLLARCPERDLQGFGGWLGSREPLLWAVRERIACTSDCDERLCRADPAGPCAYLRRVDALPATSLVAVNHALLLSWPARYGPIERLVIDEAHELASEADRAFSEEIRARDLRSWLAQLEAGRGGLLAALAQGAGTPDRGRVAADDVRRCAAGVEEVGRALAGAGAAQETLVPIPAQWPEGSAWREAADRVTALANDLATLAGEIERLVASYRGGLASRGRALDDAVAAAASSLVVAIGSAGKGLLADLFCQSRVDTVYAARSQRRGEVYDWWLRATPLEVAPLVHARLLESARTVIAVSATLGVGGDPRPSLEKVGWQDLPAERRMDSLVVTSPFDFRRRAVLALVRGEPYKRQGFVARCADAIAAMAGLLGGRTMALFTSRQRLSDVAARLTPLLADQGLALIAQQRSGGAARLVDQFNADPRAVLAGTRSLWQGVDIPGSALSCVVVDKLPFPPPTDPLARRRAERIREAGGDPFRSLSLEPAVVSFKQMFGRLIRTESDRGFVVVLGADPPKPYLDDFVASLPGPPTVVVDELPGVLDEMRRFFAAGEDG